MEATKTSKISERKAALRETSNTMKELMEAGKIKASNPAPEMAVAAVNSDFPF